MVKMVVGYEEICFLEVNPYLVKPSRNRTKAQAVSHSRIYDQTPLFIGKDIAVHRSYNW